MSKFLVRALWLPNIWNTRTYLRERFAATITLIVNSTWWCPAVRFWDCSIVHEWVPILSCSTSNQEEERVQPVLKVHFLVDVEASLHGSKENDTQVTIRHQNEDQYTESKETFHHSHNNCQHKHTKRAVLERQCDKPDEKYDCSEHAWFVTLFVGVMVAGTFHLTSGNVPCQPYKAEYHEDEVDDVLSGHEVTSKFKRIQFHDGVQKEEYATNKRYRVQRCNKTWQFTYNQIKKKVLKKLRSEPVLMICIPVKMWEDKRARGK